MYIRMSEKLVSEATFLSLPGVNLGPLLEMCIAINPR